MYLWSSKFSVATIPFIPESSNVLSRSSTTGRNTLCLNSRYAAQEAEKLHGRVLLLTRTLPRSTPRTVEYFYQSFLSMLVLIVIEL